MKIEGMTVKYVFGINVDMRQVDPAFAERMDQLAAEHDVDPIADEGIFAIVVVGASGKRYDGAELGEVSVAPARVMMAGDGD